MGNCLKKSINTWVRSEEFLSKMSWFEPFVKKTANIISMRKYCDGFAQGFVGQQPAGQWTA
jgi:hypothetical protein